MRIILSCSISLIAQLFHPLKKFLFKLVRYKEFCFIAVLDSDTYFLAYYNNSVVGRLFVASDSLICNL